MPASAFTIGERVSCSDGPCGKLTRVVVNPIGLSVTHLVVEHWHEHMRARLVPVDLAKAAEGEVRLHCTRAEFEQLDPAEERDFVAGTTHPEYQPEQVYFHPYFSLGGQYGPGGSGVSGVFTEGQGWDRGGSHGVVRRTYTYDSVPLHEVQVRRGDHVQATDGEIGLVEGLVIDPDNHEVTHVLLQEGHLWGHKDVAIPITAVTNAEVGIRLSISKEQVAELPPVDIKHPGAVDHPGI